jgi:hypothetical protein
MSMKRKASHVEEPTEHIQQEPDTERMADAAERIEQHGVNVVDELRAENSRLRLAIESHKIKSWNAYGHPRPVDRELYAAIEPQRSK